MVTVFVEANFIIQLALEQESIATVDQICALGGRGVIFKCPVVALVEAVSNIASRNARRAEFQGLVVGKKTHKVVDDLSRSGRHIEVVTKLQQVSNYLQSLREDEEGRLDKTIRSFFLNAGQVIPFGPECLDIAAQLRTEHNLRLADSYVASCVLGELYDLKRATGATPANSVFITGDQGFVPLSDELQSLGCKLFTNFHSALEFLKHTIK